MKRLDGIAQDLMDAYYQTPFVDDNERPFDLDYFIRACADEYTALLDKEFTASLGMQRAEGVGRAHNITLPHDWITWEELSLQKDTKRGDWYVKLQFPILSFSYDQSDMGLQAVEGFGGCDPVRDRAFTSWMDQFVVRHGTMFYKPEGQMVRFTSNCCPKVRVGYVATPDGSLPIADGKAAEIKKNVLQFMLIAKQGTPVTDVTNDSNPNLIPQSEINKENVQ